MLSDWELWACANKMIEAHGDEAEAQVAERISALAQAGNEEGVENWQAIQRRLELLRSEGPDAIRH